MDSDTWEAHFGLWAHHHHLLSLTFLGLGSKNPIPEVSLRQESKIEFSVHAHFCKRVDETKETKAFKIAKKRSLFF